MSEQPHQQQQGQRPRLLYRLDAVRSDGRARMQLLCMWGPAMTVKYRLVRVFSDGRRETLCVGIESKERAGQLAGAIAEAENLAMIAEADEREGPSITLQPRKRVFIPSRPREDGA